MTWRTLNDADIFKLIEIDGPTMNTRIVQQLGEIEALLPARIVSSCFSSTSGNWLTVLR
jgi:hypothetical protein